MSVQFPQDRPVSDFRQASHELTRSPSAPARLSAPVITKDREEIPQTQSLVTSALQTASHALFGQAEFLSKAHDELKTFAASHNRAQTLGHTLAQGSLCFIAALSSTLGYLVDIVVPAALSILMGAALTASLIGMIILLCTDDPIGNLARFASTLGYICATPFQLLSECCLNFTHIDDQASNARREQMQSVCLNISQISAGTGAVIGLIGGLALKMFAAR